MMKVTAVSNRVVIDHITAGKCMKLYQFLDLDHVDATIALIKNAPSQKMGKRISLKLIPSWNWIWMLWAILTPT